MWYPCLTMMGAITPRARALAAAMHGMRRLFSVPAGARSPLDVVRWWETRRVAYNVFVGAVGLVSLEAFFFFVEESHALPAGEEYFEPIMLVVAPVVINIGYTFGWLAELFLRYFFRERARLAGPLLLACGLVFTLAFVLAPTVCWGFVWVVELTP